MLNSEVKKQAKPVILLVGWAKHGKSTTGNILLNKSAEPKCINKPFKRSAYNIPCSELYEIQESDDLIVIDTVGFGNSELKHSDIKDFIVKLSESINYKIDCVVYVFMKGRLNKYNYEFFKWVQDHLIRGACKELLLVTGANEKWIKNSINVDPNMKDIVRNCNEKCACLNLELDDVGDNHNDETLVKNKEKNQQSINSFLNFFSLFINGMNVNSVSENIPQIIIPDIMKEKQEMKEEKIENNYNGALNNYNDSTQKSKESNAEVEVNNHHNNEQIIYNESSSTSHAIDSNTKVEKSNPSDSISNKIKLKHDKMHMDKLKASENKTTNFGCYPFRKKGNSSKKSNCILQ